MELELFYGGRYFKGDSIRLCLAYAGLEFEDIRQDHARWPEFDAMKAAGELPFGQMPVLRVGGAGGTLCAPHQIPPPPPPHPTQPASAVLGGHCTALAPTALAGTLWPGAHC